MFALNDTIAATATPRGTSAIAMVRVSGPGAGALAQSLLGQSPLPRMATHADYRSLDGSLLDDALFTYFASPRSYTGEDTLEISCHGNPYITQKVLEDLCARGCRLAEPGEFTRRAFQNGQLDLSQAEAVMDLIHARSERALAAANQQLRGALGQRMQSLIDLILSILARVEAYIDFPDEDLPPENRAALENDVETLIKETGKLLATNRYGRWLREGIRTVIVGETNAGKSSLLNRLVGRDRALVSAEPGTTRDYLEEPAQLSGHLFRFVDTAGLNNNPGKLESAGITKTHEQVADADLFMWVLDSSNPLPSLPEQIKVALRPDNTVIVLNKNDLSANSLFDGLATYRQVSVSALTGNGIEELISALVALAIESESIHGEEIVAINSRHALALDSAKSALQMAQTKLQSKASPELLASDLRMALADYGEIAGRVDNERVLDTLFKSFCIGK